MAEKYTRKLIKAGTNSYVLTVPKELIDKFGWREHQKLEVVFGGRKHEFTVRDWKPKRKKR